MMNANWLLILLPIAAASGWFLSWLETRAKSSKQAGKAILPSSLMTGLNQLLSQEEDKALKTFLSLSQDQPDHPELQLTLGRLSRRKGEFERATYIHQSILDNAAYSDSIRELASYELAKDYYAAGLYDRAEELFLELKNNGQQLEGSVTNLLEIYQHEKDWLSAIELLNSKGIKELKRYSQIDLAHYYCEYSEELIELGDFKAALKYADQAEALTESSPRTIILLGKISAHTGRHEEAVSHWKKLQWHEPHYLGEVIGHVSNSYEILGKTGDFARFLKSTARINPDPRLISYLVEVLQNEEKPQSIKTFVKGYLRDKPTLGGIHQLMKNWLDTTNDKLDQDTVLIVESVSKLIANERNYACLECGFTADKHHWQCPACQQWEVVKPSYLLNTPLSNNPLSNNPLSKMTDMFEDVVAIPSPKLSEPEIKESMQ